MATAMESPMAFPESPMEGDDIAYPCKGCGQILEEGKAFELAGNRWHIDCFRCNTCGTLLDSDANLLLLGDGSLICNNCTYSCSNCGNKIEDLAILTGDQAFCANCFKCRNCKRKIENLRYARTSQGIFCMDCHEALMARRRKKSKASRSKVAGNNGVQLDKSLPAIPPPEARKTAYVPEPDPVYEEQYHELPTPDIPSVGKTISELQKDVDSRPSSVDQNQPRDMLTLPSTTYRNNRHSMMSQRSDFSGGGEEFLIPLAFDPTPQPSSQSPSISSQATPRGGEDKTKDYFTTRPTPPQVQAPAPKPLTSSPHIAYQEKGRQTSREVIDSARKKTEGSSGGSSSVTASPYLQSELPRRSEDSSRPAQVTRGNSDLLSSEKFKLQEAPKTKKTERPATNLRSDIASPRGEPVEQFTTTTRTIPVSENDTPSDNGFSTPRLSNHSSPAHSTNNDSPKPTQLASSSSLIQSLPKRGDSLDSAKRSQTIARKELNASANIPSTLSSTINGNSPSPKNSATTPTNLARANGGKVISGPIGSPNSKSIFDTADDPLESSDSLSGRKGLTSFVDPRAPPLPPADHSRSQSVSTLQSNQQRHPEGEKSPGLPRYSTGGDFTMDEDMARIMGADEASAHESFLKRVSNSVRHGRSYSDKTGRLSRDRWPRSPAVPPSSIAQEISSPSTASPENRDELAWFKNELRRERQKTIEREKRIAELQSQLESTASIKQVNSELREKRSTMVVLDTQKEIVVRELEILTEHLAAAKRSGEPFDVGKMSNTVLRDFAEALEKLKNSFAPQIEDSIQRRNDLVDEIANLTQMKDKSFMEFEQLSSKNAQLAELNNQLVHQIQGLYKANSGNVQTESTKSAVNGLGIYSHHKDKSNISFEAKDMRSFSADNTTLDSGSTLLAGEAEPVTVLQGPQVVNIKKGQAKKFDWRKGQKVAKGVTKGLKGAFSSTQQSYSRDLQFAETGAYGNTTVGQEYSSLPKNNPEPMMKQSGFGFFGGNQKTTTKSNGLYAAQNNTSNPSFLVDASQVFGSDLEQRTEYEKAAIPTIVRRCVEEVELRGMDVEGIYRKSGGNSQVQQVKDYFENPTGDFDISDPDLDIHAVTSGLKQYFRRLPMPLITFDVYDRLLDTTVIQDRDARVDSMAAALEGLPRAHYEVLDYLIQHLARVVLQEKENLMTSMNIAVVFAPTIMRPESLNRELSDTKMKNEVVMWMVENCEAIFQVGK